MPLPKIRGKMHELQPLGKLFLSTKHWNEGTLGVRAHCGTKHPEFPNTKVSPQFQHTLSKILHDTNTDAEAVIRDSGAGALFPDEKKLLDRLLHRSGIIVMHPSLIRAQNRAELETWLVMLSEWRGGNDAPHLLQDLKTLGMELVRLKVLKRQELNKLLDE